MACSIQGSRKSRFPSMWRLSAELSNASHSGEAQPLMQPKHCAPSGPPGNREGNRAMSQLLPLRVQIHQQPSQSWELLMLKA